MALEHEGSLSEFVHKLQTAPLNTLRSWAKSLFTSKRYEESFEQYRVIVEGMEAYLRTADDYELYRKCIESMTGMLGADGELKTKQDYPLYRLIPYLQVIIDHGIRDEILTYFLKVMEDRLAEIRNPTTGGQSPEIPSVNQHSYTMSPVVIRPLQIAEGSTVHNPELPERQLDKTHQPLSQKGRGAFERWNPHTPVKKLEALEFQVEPDYQKVNSTLREDNWAAEQQELNKPEGIFFRTRSSQIMAAHDVTGFQSEYSKHRPDVGIASAQGKRSSMEDAHTASEFSFNSGKTSQRVRMTAVCDGHSVNYAGHLASNYVANKLGTTLKSRLEQYNPDGLTEAGIWNAISLSMADIDWGDYLFEGGIDHTGTTVNVVLTIGDRLWVANVGDSRAMLVLPTGRALQISSDAKPFVDSSSRAYNGYTHCAIQRGGRLEDSRIFGPVKGNLATTHSIGDHSMGGAISPRPTITSYPLSQIQDSMLIQCCDGVFDVANCQQIANLAIDTCSTKGTFDPKQIAENIVTASFQAGSGDNLTAVVSVV